MNLSYSCLLFVLGGFGMELRIGWIGYTHCSQGEETRGEETRGEEKRWGWGDQDSGWRG